jgi:hypothetical protein
MLWSINSIRSHSQKLYIKFRLGHRGIGPCAIPINYNIRSQECGSACIIFGSDSDYFQQIWIRIRIPWLRIKHSCQKCDLKLLKLLPVVNS